MEMQKKSESPSKYKATYSTKHDCVVIMHKDTEEVLEAFSMEVTENFLSQRMLEIRQDELLRNAILTGTKLDVNNSKMEGGIITSW
jgi:hypothetical protein